MRAAEIMHTPVVSVREDETVARLCDLLQQEHVNGLPVVDETGALVGIVTEEDILYGMMGAGEVRVDGAGGGQEGTRVRDIMTSPAVCAAEDTDLVEVCRLMWRMRIHRVPILRDGRPVGVVAAMDIVRCIATGGIVP